MKKLLLFSALLCPLFASHLHAAPAKKGAAKKAPVALKWHLTMQSALLEAKKTGKPIFVDVFTTWCGPCKYLDEVTYKDPRFIAELKKWVVVKIDAEKNKTNAAFASRVKIEGYPTLLFLDNKGKEKSRLVGFAPESLFSEFKKAYSKADGTQGI